MAGIILLRATLTFLIHWEIRNEENDGHANQEAAETVRTEESVKRPEPIPAEEGMHETVAEKAAEQVQETEAVKAAECVQETEEAKGVE